MPGRKVRPGEAGAAVVGRRYGAATLWASKLIAPFFMSRDSLADFFGGPQYAFGRRPLSCVAPRDRPGRTGFEEGRRRAVRSCANAVGASRCRLGSGDWRESGPVGSQTLSKPLSWRHGATNGCAKISTKISTKTAIDSASLQYCARAEGGYTRAMSHLNAQRPT